MTEALGWANPSFTQQMMDTIGGDAMGSDWGGFLEVCIELLRLEKILKITESNHNPTVLP